MKKLSKLMRLGLITAVSMSGFLGLNAVSAELETVNLGMLPIVNQAPVFLGDELGYFEEEGLKINPRMFQGGAAIASAVISGDVDFGYGNVVSVALAFSNGAPVRIVATSELADDSVIDAVLVKKDSPITRLKELEGKRVAVNSFKNILELVVREGVRVDGGDPDKVVFVEAPFPQMGALLNDNHIDVAVNVEPFVTMMVESGHATVLANAFEVIKGMPAGIWSASERTSQNKEKLDRFRRAIGKANIYAKENPQEVRRIIQTFTRISPDAANKIALPAWTAESDIESVQMQIDMLMRHNFLPREFKATEIMVE
ncbi:ABC transporter substrate-binding protein [Eoetvoesiella caeni]